jgi:DNA polymerase/3'-5' exonuclease PolX
MTNHLIANQLLKHARMLDRNANLYRIRSYRHAAMVLQAMDRPAAEILKYEGRVGLAAIPGIGEHIAWTIDLLVRTGRFIRWSDRKGSQPNLEKVA